MTERPKVSVYTPSHNYGRFLGRALSSLLAQSYDAWEVLVFLDGAKDESEEVAVHYAQLAPEKVRIFRNEEAKGLQYCANKAIDEARGDFIMRLDADDFLDESALLVLSNYLEKNPEIALVYPNYFYVDETGEIIDVDIRKKLGTEAKVLDLPAHGACTMIRKRVLKSVGGYDERFKAQDGYDIWLSIVGQFPVANVSTPLFFYRQHRSSLTRDENRIISAQSEIRAAHVSQRARNSDGPHIRKLGVIGAKFDYPGLPGLALKEIAGRPLLDFTIAAALKADVFDDIIVSTDSPEVVQYCEDHAPEVQAIMRSEKLSRDAVAIEGVIYDAVTEFESDRNIYPDIVAFLNSNAPLREAAHIQNAINTLLLHNTDSVVSVYEDFDLHYTHGASGLTPISRERHMQIRVEREALYADNRAIRVAWREAIEEAQFTGNRVGHFVMPILNSYHIRTSKDFDLVSTIIEKSLHR